jgi:hypothetical protein
VSDTTLRPVKIYRRFGITTFIFRYTLWCSRTPSYACGPVGPLLHTDSSSVLSFSACLKSATRENSVSGPKSETATSQRGSSNTAILMTRRHNPEGTVMTFQRHRNLTSPNVSRCNRPPSAARRSVTILRTIVGKRESVPRNIPRYRSRCGSLLLVIICY